MMYRESIWEEVAVAYFKHDTRSFRGRTEKNYKPSQDSRCYVQDRKRER